MKQIMLLLVFCMGCFLAVGAEISEDELERLERSVKIGSVNDDTIENEADEEFIQLKFYTYQNEDDSDEYTFRLRVTIELTDKQKNSYFAQMAREQGSLDTEYTGEDNWEFLLPIGDLNRPKVTAYVIQYGILVDAEFIVLAEETDDVDTVEELTERSPTRLEPQNKNAVIKHQYKFRDSDEGEQYSDWK